MDGFSSPFLTEPGAHSHVTADPGKVAVKHSQLAPRTSGCSCPLALGPFPSSMFATLPNCSSSKRLGRSKLLAELQVGNIRKDIWIP